MQEQDTARLMIANSKEMAIVTLSTEMTCTSGLAGENRGGGGGGGTFFGLSPPVMEERPARES